MGLIYDDNKVYETKDGQRFYSEGDAQRAADYKAGRQRDEERQRQAEDAAIDNYSRVKGAAEDAFEEKNYPEALQLYNELVVLVEHDTDNVYSEEKDVPETYFIRATINRALGNHKAAGSDYCIAIREGKAFDEATLTDLGNYFTQQGWNFGKTYRDERKKLIVIDNFRTPWNVITRLVGFFFVAAVLLRLFVYDSGRIPIWGIIIALIFGAFLGFIFPFFLGRVGGRRSSLLNRAKFNGIKVGKFNYIVMAVLLCFGYSCANGTYEKVTTGTALREFQTAQETATHKIGDSVTVYGKDITIFTNSNFDGFVRNVNTGDKLTIVGNKVVREYGGNNFNYWLVEIGSLRGLIPARNIMNSSEYTLMQIRKEGSLFDSLSEPLSDLFKSLLPKTNFNIGDTVMVKSNVATLWDIRDDRYALLKILNKGDELTINGDKYKDKWSVEYEGTQGWINAVDIKLKK